MLIPHKYAIAFLSNRILRKSFIGLMQDCIGTIEQAKEVAHKLEDYEFLHHFTTNTEYNDANYDFFWDYQHRTPLALKKGQNFTPNAWAKLSIDLQKRISQNDFESVIETIAIEQSVSPEIPIAEFRTIRDKRQALYRLEYEKIQRNEICPCGSGKKFKNCHGLEVG